MITWEEGQALLAALPNYWHHAINKIYQDGNTYEVRVWYLDGSHKDFIAVIHKDSSGVTQIDKYKLLVD